MSLSKPQNLLYFRLWGQVRKANPQADRKAMHAEPSEQFPRGLPESHTCWNNAHMDEWIARCKAITEPANFVAQHRQAGMDATRGRVFLRHLLAALEKPEEWLEGILATMHRNKRVAFGKSGVHVDALERQRIDWLIVAVKKECRRTWPTKDDLLQVIYELCVDHPLNEKAAYAACARALNRQDLGRGVRFLVYEDLLVVLSTLRQLVAEAEAADSLAVEGVDAENIPF